MSAWGLGRVKTKSDLVEMPSGRQIFASKARITVPQHFCPLHLNEQISAAMNRRSAE
jgi:hypothetical protein